MNNGYRPPSDKMPEDYVFMQFAPEGECSYCDNERAKGNTFFPPHTARWRCRSGRYNHCTCDGCF